MSINNQFSIAVHLMVGLGYEPEKTLTSAYLASSVNTSASFVRRILSKLSKAALIHTSTGKMGFCMLAKDPAEISLLDIYQAVESPKAFAVHNYDIQKACPVSCNIKPSLEKVLAKTQKAMEQSLSEVSLAEVITDIKR